MLTEVLEVEDALYWEVNDAKPPSPKRKCPQAKEESLNNSVPTVNTAMSTKKPPKSALKGNTSNSHAKTQTRLANDLQTVASQVMMISQMQQDHKMLLSQFNHLTE